MKRSTLFRTTSALAAILALTASAVAQTVSFIGGTVNVNFDSMGSAGTNTPAGFFVGSNSASAIHYTTNVTVSDGSVAPGGARRGFNLGSSGATDRALGVGATGSNRYIEGRIRNNTIFALDTITVHYDGEQWRVGTNNANTTLTFQFSSDGANYTAVGSGFDFVQPVSVPANNARDGNLAANRVPNIGGTFIPAAPVPPGGTAYLRWFDSNDSGTDPVLGIDNLSFSATFSNVPVTIAISSPTNGQVFSASADVPVAITNFGSVSNVAFYADGTYVATDRTAPFAGTIPSVLLPEGSHALTAVATNGLGQPVMSDPVTIVIIANQPPTIEITNTLSGSVTGAVFLVGAAITNQARVQDDVAVTNVDWLLDGSLYVKRTAAPFTWVYIDSLPGTHTLQGIATDRGGLQALSPIVTVTVTNPPSNFALLVSNGSDWKYFASSNQPPADGIGQAWFEPSYDDSGWSNGLAELGGGDAAEFPERTPLNIGPTGNRYRTIYFRRTFEVADPTPFGSLIVRLLRDDGAVVYLNGAPLWTNNINPGTNPVTYATLAQAAATDGGTVFFDLTTYPGALVSGFNALAVEVHQSSANSSDLSFDLMLWGEAPTSPILVITSPTNGQTFVASADVPVTVYATTFVTNALLFLDGEPVGEDSTRPFSMVISNIAPGAHELMAVGTDVYGTIGVSDPVAILVTPNQPPAVAITNLFSGANTGTVFAVGSAITCQLTASDDVLLTNLDFLVDGALHLRRAPAVGQVVVNDALAGTHTFQAVATDRGGLSTFSTAVTVTVTNPPPSFVLLLTNGAAWQYYSGTSGPPLDGGSLAWFQTGYDDSLWLAGRGDLGNRNATENNPHRTPIDIGPSTNRNRTVYFRTTFQAANPNSFGGVAINLLRDDGAVVYLNGTALWTNNISPGTNPITYATLATGAGDDGTVYQVRNVSPDSLLSGQNTVAVEVHQTSATSSDLTFDLMLWGEIPGAPTVVITSPTNGQAFPASANVPVTVMGSRFVTNVTLFMDGDFVNSDSVAPFSLVISNIAEGVHELLATGDDIMGNIAVSDPVTILVTPNQPPLAAITNVYSGPNTGLVFLVGTPVTNQLGVSDDVRVTSVALYVDGVFYYRDATSPFGPFTLIDRTAGEHIVQAVALDNGGLSNASAPVLLTFTNPPLTLLVTNGAAWNYFATNSAPPDDGGGLAWIDPAYDDSSWAEGSAELGAGDGAGGLYPEATVVDIGPTGSRYHALYFRHAFTVPSPAGLTGLVVNFLHDDGGVVYLNGVEVFRSNMPAGAVSYATFSADLADDDGTVYVQGNTDTASLRAGRNVLAVEVHQDNANSSDVSFDLMLWAKGQTGPVLQIVLQDVDTGRAVLLWDNDPKVHLQSAPELASPASWVDVPGALSPLTVNLPRTPGMMQFYRLRIDP